ncbi:hypothetical protein DL96DRAFT_1579349 [Flagelloscypha sp. PMI_526]|nr:hypothetical protein DL96DRAFT_1579349 [Flagelloscypha sp. PMI_526]
MILCLQMPQVLRWKSRSSLNQEPPRHPSSTTQSPQLPPELWEIVASYLRYDELWDVRSLNSTLLTLAMKARYGVVSVQPDYRASPSLHCYLKRLRDPYVHHLAHTLVVSSGAQYRFRYWNRHLYPWIAIPALKYEGTSSHYMHSVWRMCTANVTHLTLQIALTLPALSHIIYIDPCIKLAKLKSARVEFRPQVPLPQAKKGRYTSAARRIVALLPDTLEELTLGGCMDQAENFPCLRILRCEEFLKLSDPPSAQTSVIAMFEILHLKGNGLNIRDLELNGGIRELLVDQDAITAIEHGVAANLRRIDLGRCPYYRRGFDQRKDDLLAGLHQLAGIQELAIQVDELNPEVLARLTLSLPLDGLQLLHLAILDRVVEGSPSVFELTSKFPVALPLEWPRWKVRFKGIGKELSDVDLDGMAPIDLLNEKWIWQDVVQAYIRCLD